MRSCFLLFFTVLIIQASAQNTDVDSLMTLLASAKDDVRRVEILEDLSYAYLSTSPDISMKFANQGMELAIKNNDIRGQAICTLALANVYHSVGDYVRSLDLNFQAIRLKEMLKDQNFAVNYFDIATNYTEQEDYSNAIKYVFMAKEEDEKRNDSTGILFDFYTLSAIYTRIPKVDSALHYGFLAYDLGKRLNDKNLMPAVLNNFGEIYLFKEDLALAKKYYNESIPFAIRVNDLQALSMNLLGLAKIAKINRKYDSATYYGRRALAIAEKNRFLKEAYMCSTLLTEAFKETNRYDSGIKYLEKSLAARDSLYSIDKVKKFQNLRLQEQERQQEIEAATLSFENEVRFYSVLAASVVFLFIAGLLWRNNQQRKKSYAALEEQKMKTEDAYQELKSTQEQLIHSEKMASLGELTAGIAHEIQNPLNFVNNFSELNKELIDELKSEITAGDTSRMLSTLTNLSLNEEKIMHHGKRADSIVKGMLQHSRISGTQKELTDINELADDYLRLAYHGLKAKEKSFNAKFETVFDPKIGKVSILPQDIGRVILNLLNNAFYAVTNRRKLNEPAYEPLVTVKTQLAGDEVLISIADNGTGIPKKVLAKIFQPFFTTKPPGEGTGLGLSLSYDIIKAHGGNIQVKTDEGKGTEFVISLPVQG